MPYYFIWDDLPPERPSEPMRGEYVDADARVRIEEQTPQPTGRLMGLMFRLLGLTDVHAPMTLEEQQVTDVLEIMRQRGLVALDCHYDGGSDEGFSYFDSATTVDGKLTQAEVLQRLKGTRLSEPEFVAAPANLWRTVEDREGWVARRAGRTEEQRIEEWLDQVVEFLAVALLGEGYGTGDYAMVGRFHVDLQTGEITDLPIEPEPDFRDSETLKFYFESEE
jgi:hypothetical protein